MHEKEEELKIHQRVGVTKEVYRILRKRKTRLGISMSKIVCNLVLEADAEKKKFNKEIKKVT